MKFSDKKVQNVLKELEKNHQHSIYDEVYLRNRKHLNKIALLYRGNQFSYGKLFEKVESYANSLQSLGYKKGDKIPLCMKMSPEFVYLFLAISKIGAIMNPVGEWFNQEYLKEIFNDSKSDYIFITSNVYEDLKCSVEASKIKYIVFFDLDASLVDKRNPYENTDMKFIDMHATVSGNNLISYEEFIKLGILDEKNIRKNHLVNLDDDFTITYTSGTTNPNMPKAIIHSIRSYMTISRFKDPDISGLGTMKNLVVLAHFPTYIHAGITTSITDTLFRSCTIALEPIYEKDYFIHALINNQPNFVCAGVGFWEDVSKKLSFVEEYKNITMPYLFIAAITGEAMSKGEEKFFNKVAKQHRFGTAKLPYPLAPIKFSIGGGTSESSGVLVTLYKALQEKRPYYALKKKSIGLTPLGCCKVKVIDKNGNNCGIDEIGNVILSGPCTMKGYYKKSELTMGSMIIKREGKIWLEMGVYGSLDKKGTLKIYGRITDNIMLRNGNKYPFYKIEEVIGNIDSVMSCTVVQIDNQIVVIHIEPQPDEMLDCKIFLSQIEEEIERNCPKEILKHLYIRIRNSQESFPIAPSGKRDKKALIDEGIEQAEKICAD